MTKKNVPFGAASNRPFRPPSHLRQASLVTLIVVTELPVAWHDTEEFVKMMQVRLLRGSVNSKATIVGTKPDCQIRVTRYCTESHLPHGRLRPERHIFLRVSSGYVRGKKWW